jgi:hypothetical protein
MEALITNVDARTTRIEQILPTLATKDDLKNLATKAELREGLEKVQASIQEVRRHAMVLNEAVRNDIRLLAEHIAGQGSHQL